MSAELMRSYLDLLNEQQHHTKITGDQLDEIDRRGFLKGAGAAVAGAALGSVLPQTGQAASQATPTQTAGLSTDEIRQGWAAVAKAVQNRRYVQSQFDPNDKNYLLLNGRRYKVQQASPEMEARPPANAMWAITPYGVGNAARTLRPDQYRRLGLFMPDGVVYVTGYPVSQDNAIRQGQR